MGDKGWMLPAAVVGGAMFPALAAGLGTAGAAGAGAAGSALAPIGGAASFSGVGPLAGFANAAPAAASSFMPAFSSGGLLASASPFSGIGPLASFANAAAPSSLGMLGNIGGNMLMNQGDDERNQQVALMPPQARPIGAAPYASLAEAMGRPPGYSRTV